LFIEGSYTTKNTASGDRNWQLICPHDFQKSFLEFASISDPIFRLQQHRQCGLLGPGQRLQGE